MPIICVVLVSIPQIRQDSVTVSQVTEDLLDRDQHLSVHTIRKRANSYPDDISDPSSSQMPVSPGLSSALGSGLGTASVTESGAVGSGATVSTKEDEVMLICCLALNLNFLLSTLARDPP